MEPDRISLLNTARCLLEDRPFESDVALPLTSTEFIETTDALKPLLLALRRGELEAKGEFARVRLDYPEADHTTGNAELTELSVKFRRNEWIILGIGAEQEPSKIPASAWWHEGAIWEQSTLWVARRDDFDEQSWRRLKIQPSVQFMPERPYEFEELICFREVALAVQDVRRWADAHTSIRPKAAKPRGGNAGRPPNAKWSEVEDFLLKQINSGAVWNTWHDVWGDVVPMVEKVNQNVTNSQPYKPLENHLRRKDKPLLELLRSRIQSSRS